MNDRLNFVLDTMIGSAVGGTWFLLLSNINIVLVTLSSALLLITSTLRFVSFLNKKKHERKQNSHR